MKKTLSITIGGFAYTIEEDAYQILEAYLNGLRAHFSHDENIDELITDIEASIAEKFAERTQKKLVIGRDDVESVIAVMGKIEEIDDEAAPTDKEDVQKSAKTDSSTTEDRAEKRLYRDGDDAVIAGVASGIAAYLGIDTVFVRIAFILLAFVNGLGILLYLILWLAMPKAQTSSQKLAMHGRPVTINELQEVAKEKAKTMTEEGKEAVERFKTDSSLWQRILGIPVAIVQFFAKAIRGLIRFIVPFIAAVLGVTVVLGSFIALVGITIVGGVLLFNVPSTAIISDLPLHELAGNPYYYTGIIAGFFAAFIPVLVGLMAGLSLLLKRNLFSILLSSLLAGVWLIALTTWVICGVQLSPWLDEKLREANQKTLVTQRLELKDFESIQADTISNLVIKKGEVFSVELKGAQEVIDRTQAKVIDGTLFMAYEPYRPTGICLFCRDQRLSGEITMPDLKRYGGSGTSRAEIIGFDGDLILALKDAARFEGSDLAMNRIEVKLEDVARASLEGESTYLTAEVHDAARLAAEQLKASFVAIVSKDVARADVWPLQSIAATSTAASRIDLLSLPATSTLFEIGNSHISTPSSIAE